MLQPNIADQQAVHNDAFVTPRADGELRHQRPHAPPRAELEEVLEGDVHVGFVRNTNLDELVERGEVGFEGAVNGLEVESGHGLGMGLFGNQWALPFLGRKVIPPPALLTFPLYSETLGPVFWGQVRGPSILVRSVLPVRSSSGKYCLETEITIVRLAGFSMRALSPLGRPFCQVVDGPRLCLYPQFQKMPSMPAVDHVGGKSVS